MITNFVSPVLAVTAQSHALSFAWKHLTREGLCTIIALLIVSIFSWSVIITKARQLVRARKMTKKFYAAYRAIKDPLELARRGEVFDGAPAYEIYATGAEEMDYHLEHNPVEARGQKRISAGSFETVRVVLERAASTEALALERGMIVLSTAVAGGPFIGLFGTVWGVMETFSGIGIANAASLTAMAPGVAAALLATVAGLSVAIPAMFAYNYMVTMIRGITQEVDGFTSEFATQLEHRYVDNHPIAEEIREALRGATPDAAPPEDTISISSVAPPALAPILGEADLETEPAHA
jgi:biopolymer transport protein ExbB/TolQ